MNTYQGQWEGQINNKNAFNFKVEIQPLANHKYHLTIANTDLVVDTVVTSKSPKNITLDLPGNLRFNGAMNINKTSISGFFTSGILQYHVLLKTTGNDKYTGTWNIFMVDQLLSQSMYLSIENASEENYEAYPFFKDQRFTGTWCANFSKKDDIINFYDFKTGLQFRGKLKSELIEIDILLAGKSITKVAFRKSKDEWQLRPTNLIYNATYKKPNLLEDGWKISDLNTFNIDKDMLGVMEDSIQKQSLTHVHSVLIAKEEKLIYENYFSSHNQDISHDQRSASKSISSAMIGIAIDHNILPGVNQSIYNYIPKPYQYTKDSTKSKITIAHLLTMSSGIDAIDFGIDRKSIASENNYQPTQDWLKTVLEAPMVYQPGDVSNYGSANPYLLGVILGNTITEPLELFMDQKLFEPLGISNYIIQNNEKGTPYFGGGMYLTPRDMLKFGQLYLNKGVWKGNRIISEKWVEESFKKHHILANTKDKNEYGYLWWHKTYTVKGKKIKSIEARGAGGQYIFVIPELNLVAAITSGNYRNGRYWQPEKIMENYILPAVINP
ncbi:serine hydrolase domain-containing protein [Aquimarina atlantica]|nr:serine hydrolase [Aquimarina atlantica]